MVGNAVGNVKACAVLHTGLTLRNKSHLMNDVRDGYHWEGETVSNLPASASALSSLHYMDELTEVKGAQASPSRGPANG